MINNNWNSNDLEIDNKEIPGNKNINIENK